MARKRETGPVGGRRDPLDATPVVAPGVEVQRDDAGLVQLRRPVPSRGKFRDYLERMFGFNRHVHFKLDKVGSTFWEQIDGQRGLHDIERCLREQFGFTIDQSTKAVVAYTKALMVRGLVCLRLPGQTAGGE